MAILGAHMSIAGGYYKAVELAHANTCDCVQVFTKNNTQWRAKPLTDDDAARFQEALVRLKITHPIAHDSYLINLASPNRALWQKSVEAFADELLRAERLGIPYVVTHPGAFTTSSEQKGLDRVVKSLDEVDRRTADLRVGTLLETTAGQGSCLGWRFEHLAAILAGVRNPNRLGVCVDTCHIHAAGYRFDTPETYQATMDEFDRVVGLAQIKAFHVNDSRTVLGSRVDRHAHIGRGNVGLEAFRLLMNDRRFRKTPMYLETAKEKEKGEEMDVVNLRVLRGLIVKPAARPVRAKSPRRAKK